MPSRRALLASVAVAVAGCVGDHEATGTSPGQSSTPASPTAATPTAGDGPRPPASIETSWPRPAHDAGRTSFAPGAAGPTDRPAELWRFVAPGSLSAPVVAAGTAYVGSDDGTVSALDGRSSETRWEQSVGASAGRPRWLDDTLFVPTPAELVVLDASDGTERWRVETPSRVATLVASHGVYRIADGDPPAVVALALEDGSERWRTEIGDPWRPYVFASDDEVFVSTGSHAGRPWRLAAEDGRVVGGQPGSGHDFPVEWSYRDGTVYGADAFFGSVVANAAAGGGQVWSQSDVGPGGRGAGTLSVGAEHVFYTSNADGPGLYALSATDGSVAWTADVGPEITGRPVVGTDTVVVGTDGGLRAFDPGDGTGQWTLPDGVATTGYLVVDDLLYATGDDTVRAFRAP